MPIAESLISLSSWSFHKPLYDGQMRLWDVPLAAAELGFHRVELQDMFLWPYGNRLFWALRRYLSPPSPAPADRFYDYDLLERIRTSLSRSSLSLSAWNCDPEFGRPEQFHKKEAYVQMALRTAKDLGAPILRITIDHAAVGNAVVPVINVLKRLVSYASQQGVRMALENHGREVDVEQIIRIVGQVDSEWLGVCLDFGNFKPGEAEMGFERLAPHAIHVHAKSYVFDGDGEEVNIPYQHRIAALQKAGYSGTIAIEYEGDEEPAEGIRSTCELLLRYLRS